MQHLLLQPMTPSQIRKRANDLADARMGETIERLLYILRMQHTHQSWRGECMCDYCCFIRGPYVTAKMKLRYHRKKMYYYDWLYDLTNHERERMMFHEVATSEQRQKVRELKELKKEMQQEVL